jgi:hypothetical protein
MISDELIIEIAKGKIGDYDQSEIKQLETLNVGVTINEDGKAWFYTVCFNREKIGHVYAWVFSHIVRKS